MSQPLNVLSSHFIHNTHPLILVPNEYDFTCDGCNTEGEGERYHCKQCRFDLHKECAISTANLSSVFHPNHPLDRTWERPDDVAVGSSRINRPCCFCGDQVKGLFFTCPDVSCSFFLHPVCSKFPKSVNHKIHPKHSLTLQDANDSMCVICGNNCTGFRYRCKPCRIDIHTRCLLSPQTNLGSRGCITTKSRRPREDHHGPQNAGTGVDVQSPAPSYGVPYYAHDSYHPHKVQDHGSSKGKDTTGGKREKMCVLLGQLFSAAVAGTIISIPGYL